MIFVDLDGVIANFVGGVMARLGTVEPADWNIHEWYDMTPDEFWSQFTDHDFWAGLQKTPQADELMEGVIASGDEFYFATSPVYASGGSSGKIAWLQKHYPKYSRNYFLTPHKHLLSGYGRILIDDHNVNIDKWNLGDGLGLLLERPWSTDGLTPKQIISKL